MPEQNEKKLPKAPAFNPKVKETIAAFKENNNPKKIHAKYDFKQIQFKKL